MVVPLPPSEDNSTELPIEPRLLLPHQTQPVEVVLQVFVERRQHQGLPVGPLEGTGRPHVVEDLVEPVPGVGGGEPLHVRGVHPDHRLHQLSERLHLLDDEVPQHVVPHDGSEVVFTAGVGRHPGDVVHEYLVPGGHVERAGLTLPQVVDLVTPDVQVVGPGVDGHHLVDDVLDDLHRLGMTGTNALRHLGNISEVRELFVLQNINYY